MRTLKDLLDSVSDEDVLQKMSEIYEYEPPEAYAEMLKDLRGREPSETDLSIHIRHMDGSKWYDVFGRRPASTELGLSLTLWEEWLGGEICAEFPPHLEVSDVEIVCACVCNMTSAGHSKEKQQAFIDEMDRRVKALESGEAKTIPYEQLRDRLKKKFRSEF
jgi:hypothetical protein